MTSESDAHMADATKLNADEAFEKVVADHQRFVLGLAQSMGFRHSEIDDAAAEVFAAVFVALPAFEGRCALSTWVYQIACRTLWRLRGKLRARSHRQSHSIDAAIEENRPESESSPYAAAVNAEECSLIWNAVASLEPKQVTVIELFYRRGWSVEQIAATMDCPIGTVKTLLFRGRENLRKILSRQLHMPMEVQ